MSRRSRSRSRSRGGRILSRKYLKRRGIRSRSRRVAFSKSIRVSRLPAILKFRSGGCRSRTLHLIISPSGNISGLTRVKFESMKKRGDLKKYHVTSAQSIPKLIKVIVGRKTYYYYIGGSQRKKITKAEFDRRIKNKD